ncbi:MAG: hypothetical protein V1672_00845 [Candidatus Diapherotrites archaeon]
MEFKLSEGPWKEIFTGRFNEYEVEIFTNPDGLVLVAIYEREGTNKTGVVLELYKIFYSIGDVDDFVETLPREVIALTKHDEKVTQKFFLLGSTPTYVKYEEDEIIKEVDRLIRKLQTSAKMIKDVSKAYDITFKELSECDEGIKDAFFSQPLLIPIVSTSSHSVTTASKTELSEFSGEAILGITKDGTIVKEPISLFKKTIITDGESDDRLHLMRILAESYLISNTATVIFDWGASFSGLSSPTKKRDELKKYKVGIEPIGFPVKEFSVPSNVKVDLHTLDSHGLMELFAAGEGIVSDTIMHVIDERKFKSLKEIVDRIKEVNCEGDFSEFQKLRAVRLLRLIDLRYPELFDGENDVAEISKNWFRGIGRAGIVKLSDIDERASLIIVQSLLKGILEYYKKEGPTKGIKSVIVIPEADKIINSQNENSMSKNIANDLDELGKYGVAYVLGAHKNSDLTRKIIGSAEAKLSIIRENDVGVELKDRKQYRVLVRPSLSESSETK